MQCNDCLLQNKSSINRQNSYVIVRQPCKFIAKMAAMNSITFNEKQILLKRVTKTQKIEGKLTNGVVEIIKYMESILPS